MSVINGMGKVPQDFLEDVVFENLGARNGSIIVGPGQGRDNAVLAVNDGQVMISTCDPLSILPTLGMEDSAWLSAHLLASDLSASGVRPQYGLLDFNLPPQLELADFAYYLKKLGAEFASLGVSIIGGHTGKYPGCDFSIVGGGVLFSFSQSDAYVTPSMARTGDKVLITKGAAIATTAILARAFPGIVRDKAGKSTLRRAQARLEDCSTVKEALALPRLGLRKRISSMHDATEGGILGGLHELSIACRKSIVVKRSELHVAPETSSVCSIFGLNPLTSLSEGTLIVTCSPESVHAAISILAEEGIECAPVGEVKGEGRGLWISRDGSGPTRFRPPRSDPYWSAYAEAIKRGWK